MAQPLAEKDTAWLARFVEDMIRNNAPAALVNMSAEEITVTEMLNIADQMSASQQAIDFMRPGPQVLLSNTVMAAALPSAHTVNVARFVKSGVLVVDHTGFTPVANTLVASSIAWDGVTLGTLNMMMNTPAHHMQISSGAAFSLSDVAVGSHTLTISNGGNLTCDANDHIRAILFGG